MKQPINPLIKTKKMAKGRTPKDRTAEIQAVYDGLKFCSITDLNQIIKLAKSQIEKKKESEKEALKNQIAELQKQLEDLEK